ncbi:retinoid-inducible serine carboxypeptidase-like [Crassostrea angulata]|uniref:retinoid-inducible serine carboxypeptidase-like n=1 Tax=Magallana angulata TaxID=2784310 RepID=UPI0022B11A7A|nr:retinoid-inducible serine carboxypeptidase-like [Crassostrea angulata]
MSSFGIWFHVYLTCCLVLYTVSATTAEDWEEQWDYVTVRPGARMFYWLYQTTSPGGSNNVPLIMWLQGGPGQSSTGMGNFEEIGPLDISLKQRNTTWLSEASLLFVDSPVGSGYSYVESKDLYCNSTEMIAEDMITFLKIFFSSVIGKKFQQVPFYIMTESYGGKMTAVIADQLIQAISEKKLECLFVGVTLGAPFIHPEVTVQSWIEYAVSNALIDNTEAYTLTQQFWKIKGFILTNQWEQAYNSMFEFGVLFQKYTNYVDMYNMLLWGPSNGRAVVSETVNKGLLISSSNERALWTLMNGKIRKKLKIIPKNIVWGGQNGSVYESLKGDFMKPAVKTVNKLVSQTSLQVAVYTGQLDIIVNTLGTLKWVSTLDIYGKYTEADRQPFPCPQQMKNTCGFVKTYKNFSMFWIMNAGHMVPKDNGAAGLEMVKRILRTNKKQK